MHPENGEKAKDNEVFHKNDKMENYKGVYFKEQATKYFDPITGAHFEYQDMCTKLEKIISERNAPQPRNSLAIGQDSPVIELEKPSCKKLNESQDIPTNLDEKISSSPKAKHQSHRREHSTETKKPGGVRMPICENASEILGLKKLEGGLGCQIKRKTCISKKHNSIFNDKASEHTRIGRFQRIPIQSDNSETLLLAEKPQCQRIPKLGNNPKYIKAVKRPLSREYKAIVNKGILSEKKKEKMLKTFHLINGNRLDALDNNNFESGLKYFL